uniref:Odorant receptor n=1 Tax=Semiothisa cinerearia TaxID=2249628 RepID=A0A889XL89_9NEOP|nr:odorant receptor [Semiothisa cinerearia]
MIFTRYKKRFLVYLNKENFDHMEGLIDPFEFHSLFLVMAKLFSVMDYKEIPKWMYISPICSAASAVSAGTIFLISSVEYVRTFKVHALTECGTYLMIMCYKFLILCSIVNGKKHYHNFLQALRDDFHYICTRGFKYRDRFFANQRVTFRACVFVAIFIGSMGGGMAILACIAVLVALHRREEGAVRPLPFPFWLFGVNLHASPAYEMLFLSSMLFTFFHTYLYIFMMMSQVLWIREITCKADIIRWNLQDLLVDVSPARNNEEENYYTALIKHRMRDIIMMHHSMIKLTEDYAAVFKKCLLYEQMLASPIICMTAYCFAEKFDAGEIQLILLVLCTAVIVVVFVPSYLCTHLLEKCQSISDACWDIPFWNAGPVVRVYLVLMMQRSLRPLPIVAAGFDDISLQTYSNIMTRSYSCFNMLRQADFNFS